MKLANPLKTRTIAMARVKSGKLDSKILAHLRRCDRIAEFEALPEAYRLGIFPVTGSTLEHVAGQEASATYGSIHLPRRLRHIE